MALRELSDNEPFQSYYDHKGALKIELLTSQKKHTRVLFKPRVEKRLPSLHVKSRGHTKISSFSLHKCLLFEFPLLLFVLLYFQD